MKALTALDMASARGKHATWLNGTRPAFISAEEADQVWQLMLLGLQISSMPLTDFVPRTVLCTQSSQQATTHADVSMPTDPVLLPGTKLLLDQHLLQLW